MRFSLVFLLTAFIFFSCDSPAVAAKISPGTDTTAVDTSLHEGDIIFQSSMSGQSYAVQLATHSKYSHCGLLFKENGKWMVYEAVQPVTKTDLSEWITHGDGNHYVVRRLKDADSLLPAEKITALRAAAAKHMGKNYDLYFGWKDDRIYCSELVWKAYHDATGIEVGALKKLKDFDLSNPVVQKKMNERYGKNIPYEENVISPGSIFECSKLVTVQSK